MAAAQAGFECCIRPAVWPADRSAALMLLQHYRDHLNTSAGVVLEDTGILLKHAEESCSEPHGAFLLAMVAGVPSGCVAVTMRQEQPARCEMKRLWIEGSARGLGMGRLLVQAAAAWGRSHSAVAMLLDTLPAAMPEACALYHSLGFVETLRYNDNPVPNLLYMELALT